MNSSSSLSKGLFKLKFITAISRKDDLEALMYTLIFLVLGDLPWGITSNYEVEELSEIKSSMTTLDMCQGLPGKTNSWFLFFS